MAENNPFQRNEAEKLTTWVAQTLALKEAKVHASDAMAAIGQRGQVQIETNEMADTITPPTGEATSTAGRSGGGGGLTAEEVEQMIVDALEDYVTKDFLNDKLLEYPTWEQANEAYVDWETYNGLLDTLENDYAKKSWVDEQLEAYATKEWVVNKLEDYATKDELLNYVRKDELCDLIASHFTDGGCNSTSVEEALENKILRIVNESLQELGVDASCSEGNVTVTLTGIP